MFTGIIQSVGAIESVEKIGDGLCLRVHAGGLDLSTIKLGDSIAINGACMTVTECSTEHFSVIVSAHSLSLTQGLNQVGAVNLELALRVGDALGGHFVSGHVDGIARIHTFEPLAESWLLRVAVPPELARYMIKKGSITLNGVSLTINAVTESVKANGSISACIIDMNLIPHTIAHTTFSLLKVDSLLNLEIDLLARYVARMFPTQSISNAACFVKSLQDRFSYVKRLLIK